MVHLGLVVGQVVGLLQQLRQLALLLQLLQLKAKCGKKVTFVVAQGGSYKDGAPRAGWDFATGYLELVAKALGATDIEVILAEFTLAGVAPGMESLMDAKNASVAAAKEAARKRAA